MHCETLRVNRSFPALPSGDPCDMIQILLCVLIDLRSIPTLPLGDPCAVIKLLLGVLIDLGSNPAMVGYIARRFILACAFRYGMIPVLFSSKRKPVTMDSGPSCRVNISLSF